jgi:RNA polymerase sigma-70 factor (ECF subfamily)
VTITPPNRKCVCILVVPRLAPGFSIGWRSMEIERSGGPQRLILMTMLEGVEDVHAGKLGGALSERRSAFERLTQGRLDRAYRLAAALLGDPDEAQDAVHDAAEQAWDDFLRLRDQARFDAWFDAIVVHRCRDRLRRRRVRPLVLVDPPDQPGSDPSAVYVERDALAHALARLDADHRIVVILRFGADLTVAEIAQRTGEREGTVKSRLYYALRQLRGAYDAAARLPGGVR